MSKVNLYKKIKKFSEYTTVNPSYNDMVDMFPYNDMVELNKTKQPEPKPESEPKPEYRYFTSTPEYPWNNALTILLACNEKGGTYFSTNGEAYMNTVNNIGYNINHIKFQVTAHRAKEISLQEALKLINKEGRNNVYRLLKIRKPRRKPVDPKQKQLIIDILKSNRAFNADSADTMIGYVEICQDLVDINIIKSVIFTDEKAQNEERFYLPK